MPSLSIRPDQALEKNILSRLRARHQLASSKLTNLHKKWRESEEGFLAYVPEREADRVRRRKRELEGLTSYRTMVLPYSYAMLMAVHSYWTTVFLSRDPIYQYTGESGEGEMQVMAVEAMTNYQVRAGGIMQPLFIWLLDTGKYGIGVIHHDWMIDEFTIRSYEPMPEETETGFTTGRESAQMLSRTIMGYQGTRAFNLRPFDWFPDPRVPMNRCQDGEFCGMRLYVQRNELKRREAAGHMVNVKRLLDMASAGTREDYGSPSQEKPITDASSDRDDVGSLELYRYYVELIPSEWGLVSGAHLPERWEFIADSKFSVCVRAAPMGSLHNKYPFGYLEMEPNGYALNSRGVMEILKPIQDTIDWLLNSRYYNVRASLNNLFLVDPSVVEMGDLEDPLPGGIIRTTGAFYGRKPADAIHQLAVHDITQSNIGDINFFHEFAQRVLGANEQILGMPLQGGRRTATESRGNMTFGVNRQKTLTEYMSGMGFQHFGQVLLANGQQYYTAPMKMRIVGDAAVDAGQKFVEVNPEMIAGNYGIVAVDGSLPVDRFAQANLWREILTNAARMPPIIQQQYRWDKIFAWAAQLAGLKNIHQFRVEMMPDGQLQQQVAAGNLVPAGGGATPDLTNVPEAGRLSQTGRTA